MNRDAVYEAIIERLTIELGDATKSVAYLTGELEAVRDIAYRGVGLPLDALEAIQQRTSRAVGKGN